MTLEERRRRCGTHSGFWGWIGLDPRKEKSLVLKQQALDAQHRMRMKAAWVYGLPAWVVQPCYLQEIPSECLLGVDDCHDAKFCLMQRLMQYQHREVMVHA
jgi:hypothetical protein